MTAHRSSLGLALAAVALAVSAGCSSANPVAAPAVTSAPSQSTAAAGPTITIASFKFSELTVTAGAMVTVKNQDSANHTVKVKGTDVDVTVAGGAQATFTAPAKAGTYDLTCDFHSSMHGTLTVTG